MPFDTNYPSEPFSQLTTNQREWYDPILRDVWRRQAVYNRFVTSRVQIAGEGSPRTTQMHITDLLPPHANFDPIGLRDLWMNSSHVDTQQRTITFNRYGSKFGLHKYDPLITYWQSNRYRGLAGIINAHLGEQMMHIFDKLARNAYFLGALNGGYAQFGTDGGADLSTIANTEQITTDLIDQVHLGMKERNVPYANNTNSLTGGNIFCVTTPGVYYDLLKEATAQNNSDAFINVMRYADPTRIINNEVGLYHNTRFVVTPDAVLYNCGAITVQTTITAPASAGDGADSNAVDGVYTVGQPGATKSITVADTTGFAVNDIVTLHITRTSDYGVTNGVDFNEGTIHNLRITTITGTVGGTLHFDRPLMIDFATDLGGSVYGYVTKGRHIHTALFIGAQDGVISGWGQTPRIYTPRPVDDWDSMYRVSFDAFAGYQAFQPMGYEVLFLAGTNRYKGAAYVS